MVTLAKKRRKDAGTSRRARNSTTGKTRIKLNELGKLKRRHRKKDWKTLGEWLETNFLATGNEGPALIY